MKKIFLCNTPGNVSRVYGPDALQALGLTGQVFCREDVLADPAAFVDTQVVFSTWGMPRFTRQELQQYLPSLQAVFYGAGTVQQFARPFLEQGVRVFSAWAANAVPVAEYTLAQILLANKGFYTSSRLAKQEGRQRAREDHARFPGNFDQCVGIIGVGMIGSMVAQKLADYRLKVLAFDPFLPAQRARELGVTLCSLPELFSACQVVSNHLANNTQTRGMLDYSLFRLLPQNAAFINTGRGAQVVEADLARILAERPDLTALLDVTDPEPPVAGHPFYTLDNCILTPHIAGSSGAETLRMGEYMVEEYLRYTRQEPCRWEVTPAMLETMA